MEANKASDKPTIALVHGAFADSSSWNDIMSTLFAKGYPVVAAANPLRGVTRDAASIVNTLASIKGPGELDKNIPAASHRFMAERAKARKAIEIKGASHVVLLSYAATVGDLILQAAKNVT